MSFEEGKVYKGVVIFFSAKKGYGFISPPETGMKDIFVHYSDIDMEGYKTIAKDSAVEYEIGQNVRGQPKAIKVKRVADPGEK